MTDLTEILYREGDSVHFDSWSILIKRHRILFIEARPFGADGWEFSTDARLILLIETPSKKSRNFLSRAGGR